MSDPKSATPNRLSPQNSHAAITTLVALYDGIFYEFERALHGTGTQLERTQLLLTDALDKNEKLVARCTELEQKLAAVNSPVVKIEKAEEKPADIDPLS